MSQPATYYLTEWYASDGLPGSEPEQVASVADGSGNLYVAGVTLNAYEKYDLHLAKYDDDGDLLWSRTIDGYGYFDAAAHIHQRSSTQLTVVGVVQQDLDTWELGTQFLYMSTGALSGSLSTYGDTDLDEVRDIVRDGSNNLYVTGYVDNGATNNDIVTLKFSESLDFQWSHTYNGTSNLDDEPHSLTVDEATGNVYVAGFTTKTGEGKNFAVIKYNSSGALQWSNNRNGEVDVDDEAFDVAIDTSGQIIVGGYLTEEGNKDYFVEILSSGGSSQWTERFNGVHNLDDRGQKLVVELSGRISLTGKTGSPEGDTYTTVRYTPKSILIPPDDEDPSTGLYFTENRGQLLDTEEEAVPDIKFYSDRQSTALFFQEEGFSMVTAIMDGDTATNDTLHRVDVRFRQSKGAERIYALEQRADFHNYYLGHIPEGREKVGLYDRLIHTNAFTGIDVQYYSNNAGRKFYFVVKPGADPDDIELLFDGHSSLSVNGNGELVIGTAAGDIVLPEPEAFLVNSSGVESSVAWTPEFEVDGDTVTIGTESYDGAKWLVIRVKKEETAAPESIGNLEWCTYYGGSSYDFVRNSTIGAEGSYYVVGQTTSPNFPQLNGIHTFMGGQFDAFLVGFDDDLNRLFSTFIGGTADDIAYDAAFGQGGIVVVGETVGYGATLPNSNNFPLHDDGIVHFDGSNRCGGTNTCWDSFIAKFSTGGTRQFATFFGNDGNPTQGRETINGIEVHESGFYVAGGLGGNVPVVNTNMSDLYEPSAGDAFIASFNGNFSQLIWCSRFKAGVILEIDTDEEGNIFIGGNTRSDDNLPLVPQTSSSYQSAFNGGMSDVDGFVAKISPAPHELLWSTHYGGNALDQLYDIKIDNEGNLLIVGETSSSDLDIYGASPDDTYSDSLDGFMGKFNNTGEPIWTSYLGGASATGTITVDNSNNVYVGMSSRSEELGVQNPGGLYEQELTDDPADDAYLLVLTEDANILWSTFLGYYGFENIVSLEIQADKLYFAGNCNLSPSIPVATNDFPLVKYSPNPSSFYLDFVSKPFQVNPTGFMGRFDIDSISDAKEPTSTLSFFEVYPNPSSDLLLLNFQSREKVLVKIQNVHGQEINHFIAYEGFQAIQIPVSYLPAGIYFISADSGGTITTKKIIID